MIDSSQPLMVFHTRGNIELLSQTKVAVFASRESPAELSPAAIDLFNKLLHLPISLAGGWQSPLEKTLLKLFRPDVQANLIHYHARELNELSLTEQQSLLLGEQKLLMIAPETAGKRANQSLVRKRDALIFSHCQKVLFFYIHPQGRLEAYFNQLQQSGHSIYLFDHPLNERFVSSHVVLLNGENLETILAAGAK
ncbi:hypothetical protein Calab_1233 [Caldithrix abyssi DSM 13497]|uniref:Uncharacterized protein n=1 Tax=Caldithrix abyssi DSM 13497 TaxID=880073 RepID=H1XXY4_CALAY|nr:hypothetical protein [Caldithrix abyssi]APF20640.1 hypothetical protein Cabys_3895 [Caldithrix abyssi DSM 13497]EHO40859.1 hypothetical protein Calab_1233 [Caldithrix abyssi DSM 13497]